MLLGAVALGALSWTGLEYCLHRFLFHRPPRQGVFLDRLFQYMIHGYHHQFPQDERRLVAPVLLVAPIMLPVALAWRLAAGPTWWMPCFAGTVLGYLTYDWVHWYSHHAVPTTRLGRWLRRLQAIHHYREFHRNLGISSPMWDVLLRTYTDKPAKVTARPASPPEPDRPAAQGTS